MLVGDDDEWKMMTRDVVAYFQNVYKERQMSDGVGGDAYATGGAS